MEDVLINNEANEKNINIIEDKNNFPSEFFKDIGKDDLVNNIVTVIPITNNETKLNIEVPLQSEVEIIDNDDENILNEKMDVESLTEQTVQFIKFNPDKLTVEPRDFTKDEILEIHSYITNNIPYSILQNTLPVTENTLQKLRVYTIAYRFINGCKNYVQNDDTKKKLIKLLNDNKSLYTELYEILIKTDNKILNFGFHRIENQMNKIMCDFEKNMLINNFIDVYLIFAEKQNFVNLDSVTGFNLETDEGKESYRKLAGESE